MPYTRKKPQVIGTQDDWRRLVDAAERYFGLDKGSIYAAACASVQVKHARSIVSYILYEHHKLTFWKVGKFLCFGRMGAARSVHMVQYTMNRAQYISRQVDDILNNVK